MRPPPCGAGGARGVRCRWRPRWRLCASGARPGTRPAARATEGPDARETQRRTGLTDAPLWTGPSALQPQRRRRRSPPSCNASTGWSDASLPLRVRKRAVADRSASSLDAAASRRSASCPSAPGAREARASFALERGLKEVAACCNHTRPSFVTVRTLPCLVTSPKAARLGGCGSRQASEAVVAEEGRTRLRWCSAGADGERRRVPRVLRAVHRAERA